MSEYDNFPYGGQSGDEKLIRQRKLRVPRMKTAREIMQPEPPKPDRDKVLGKVTVSEMVVRDLWGEDAKEIIESVQLELTVPSFKDLSHNSPEVTTGFGIEYDIQSK